MRRRRVRRSVLNPITRDEKYPLELYEANNAVRIAQEAGAEKYASDIYNEAMLDLKNATDILSSKKPDEKMGITYARQAVQRSEDARLVTLRKQAAERQRNAETGAAERRAAGAAGALAGGSGTGSAGAGRCGASRAEAAAARRRLRLRRPTRVRRARRAARERLRSQLNSVLATSETARGLIVNMSDVLFDTGKYTLKPATQISLAKVSGILQSYPGLKLQVEGYTDSTGSPEFNQKLSENRAGAVRDFLVSQGVQPENIAATGYGMAKPVADNNTAAGQGAESQGAAGGFGRCDWSGAEGAGCGFGCPVAAPAPTRVTGTSNPPQ